MQIAGVSVDLAIEGQRSAGLAALDTEGRIWVLVVTGPPGSNPAGGNTKWVALDGRGLTKEEK
jgi:hypothetical protein